MTINISIPETGPNLRPLITVIGVGGSGGNAVNNMIRSNLEGVEFLIANTDAQALQNSSCERKIQLGLNTTRGLGAGMRPDVGKDSAEEAVEEINEKLEGTHMLFIAAGMGGGTGTGAAPVIAKLAREKGILTVGVVTKPFHFEGTQRMKLSEKGIEELQQYVDTLLTIPNQNLFRIANEKTTFADAFKMADDVLYAGVRGVTDLIVQPGLINLDFSDIKTVMSEMGKAMMGTGQAEGENRAISAAEAAIANPLIDDVSLKGARGLIINITGGNDITLYEVDEAANRIKQEVDDSANIIYGTTCDERLEGIIRVSIVATGIDASTMLSPKPLENQADFSINNSVYAQQSESLLADEEIENQEVVLNLNEDKPEEIDINQNKAEEHEDHLNEFNKLNDHEDTVKITSSQEYDETILSESDSNLNNEIHNVEEDLDSVIERNQSIKEDDEEESIIEDQSTSVRKLSLFDTLNEENVDFNVNHDIDNPSKIEPVIEDQNVDIERAEEVNPLEEHSPEIKDNEDDLNQDNEEELLDIPTFLRRQAN